MESAHLRKPWLGVYFSAGFAHQVNTVFHLLQVCWYVCPSPGLQQFCQTAKFAHECCSSLQGHHTGKIFFFFISERPLSLWGMQNIHLSINSWQRERGRWTVIVACCEADPAFVKESFSYRWSNFFWPCASYNPSSIMRQTIFFSVLLKYSDDMLDSPSFAWVQ